MSVFTVGLVAYLERISGESLPYYFQLYRYMIKYTKCVCFSRKTTFTTVKRHRYRLVVKATIC